MSPVGGSTGAEDRPTIALPTLSPSQEAALREYAGLLIDFNRKLNLVSRESVEDVWRRHILHSLCLACRNVRSGTTVVDWGTGGGLPLVPLAVVFPNVSFVGVDSVGKKVMAVRQMVRQLGLCNVTLHAGRAEEYDGVLDYSVSRATAPLATLWSWHTRCRSTEATDALPAPGEWPRGLMCLKGGDLTMEIGDHNTRFPNSRVDTFSLASLPGAVQFPAKVIVSVTDSGAATDGSH